MKIETESLECKPPLKNTILNLMEQIDGKPSAEKAERKVVMLKKNMLVSGILMAFMTVAALGFFSNAYAGHDTWTRSYNMGYSAGKKDGCQDGYEDAYRRHYRIGRDHAFMQKDGSFNYQAYEQGYRDGYEAGYRECAPAGAVDGYRDGYKDGAWQRNQLRKRMHRQMRRHHGIWLPWPWH
jgi:hypothetical protein